MLIDENTDRILTPKDLANAAQIIDIAKRANVQKFITIGSTSHIDSINCNFLSQQFDCVFAAIGLFPHDCTSNWSNDLQQLVPLIKSNDNIVAIGECGLDFHYPDYNENRQKDAFKAQIELALEYNKTLVIHTRQAPDETLTIIDEFKNSLPRGVFHCFSEDLNFAHYAISHGFYLGIPGTITYPKNDRLRTIVKTIGLDHIVLETDSPFLPPQHMRGKKNDPSQVATIAAFIAQLLEVDLEYVEQKTTENTKKLFQLPQR
jgi:TatD DNase family protein